MFDFVPDDMRMHQGRPQGLYSQSMHQMFDEQKPFIGLGASSSNFAQLLRNL